MQKFGIVKNFVYKNESYEISIEKLNYVLEKLGYENENSNQQNLYKYLKEKNLLLEEFLSYIST